MSEQFVKNRSEPIVEKNNFGSKSRPDLPYSELSTELCTRSLYQPRTGYSRPS